LKHPGARRRENYMHPFALLKKVSGLSDISGSDGIFAVHLGCRRQAQFEPKPHGDGAFSLPPGGSGPWCDLRSLARSACRDRPVLVAGEMELPARLGEVSSSRSRDGPSMNSTCRSGTGSRAFISIVLSSHVQCLRDIERYKVRGLTEPGDRVSTLRMNQVTLL